MPKARDLSGMQFGALKVIGIAQRLQNDYTKFWPCECKACGKTGPRVSSSNVYSCGCLRGHKKELCETLVLNEQKQDLFACFLAAWIQQRRHDEN